MLCKKLSSFRIRFVDDVRAGEWDCGYKNMYWTISCLKPRSHFI